MKEEIHIKSNYEYIDVIQKFIRYVIFRKDLYSKIDNKKLPEIDAGKCIFLREDWFDGFGTYYMANSKIGNSSAILLDFHEKLKSGVGGEHNAVRSLGNGFVAIPLIALRRNAFFDSLIDFEEEGQISIFENAIRKEMRSFYSATWTPELVTLFQRLSKRLSQDYETGKRYRSLTKLRCRLEKDSNSFAGDRTNESVLLSDLFVECCLRARILSLSQGQSGGDLNVSIASPVIDSEFLLSKLFGFSSMIPGLDDMFGGGGINWVRRIDSALHGYSSYRSRFLSIEGTPGSGKTTLSSLLAADAASNGGFAWITSVEQSPDEMLLSLSLMGMQPGLLFDYATTSEQVVEKLRIRADTKTERGLLVISDGSDLSLSEILVRFANFDRKILDQYDSVLAVIDPVDALVEGDSIDQVDPKKRSEFFSVVKEWKSRGINIVMTSEIGDSGRAQGNGLLGRVSDISLSLSVDVSSDEYHRRIFEIKKCRLQRYHRGRHGFALVPTRGLVITPEVPAISATLRNRHWKKGAPDRFGWSQLNELLGRDPFYSSDVIVFKGVSGYKLQLALLFLLFRSDQKNEHAIQSRSLMISLKHPESGVLGMIKEYGLDDSNTYNGINRTEDDDLVIVDDFANTTLHPAAVLGRFLRLLDYHESIGKGIDRIVLDNASIWESRCPFLAKSDFFMSTFVEICQKRNITLLIVCDVSSEFGGKIQSVAYQTANVVFEFSDERSNRNKGHALKVHKTRTMLHVSGWNEIYRDEKTHALAIRSL